MSTISDPRQLAGSQPLLEYGSPIGVGTTSAGEGFGVADVVRVLKQRKLMIIIIFVLTYMIVCGATAVMYIYFPAFVSTAMFELEPPPEGVYLTEAGKVMPNQMEEMLVTEAAKLRRLDLLSEVVAKPAFKLTGYYKWYKEDAAEAAVGLQEDLVIGPVPKSRLIRVSLACRMKEEARQIVQSVVDEYLDRYKDADREKAFQEKERITASLDTVREKLTKARNDANAFRARVNVPALETARLVSRDQVSVLRAEVSSLETQVAALQSQMDSIAQYEPDQLPLTAEQILMVESDPMLRYYRQQVESLDIEMRGMALRIGENHNDMKLAQKRKETFYEKEVQKREELIDRMRERQIQGLRRDLAQARRILDERENQLADELAAQRDLDRNIQTYEQLTDDIEMLKKQISEFEQLKTQAEYKLADRSRVRLTLVESPKLAVSPSRPNLVAFLGGGVMISFALGVGFAFLRELTDKAVRTPLDIVRYGHLSVLGMIPQLDDEEADIEEIEDAVRLAPHSLIAEAFRRVRTNLQFSGPPETQRSLLITSPAPEDGKTSVAINLAATMAHGGQRVLLIDCNFRRPGIRSRFANTRPEGLSNVLIGEGTFDQFVTHTDLPNFDVLTSGPMPPTPAELLGSPRMRTLITEATRKYDRVLLDGPPALLISDTTVVAALVDGVILVALADANSKGVLKRARDVFEKIDARVIGAILNGVRARAGGYFRQQYREFYDYIGDETMPAGELPEPPSGKDRDV